jgi:hypothetical protein
VFLAVDNVDFETLDEAREFLNIWKKPAGNRRVDEDCVVIVTARSIEILVRLGIDEGDCLEMPELDHEQAKCLFRESAELSNERAWEDVEYCVEKCWFRKDNKEVQPGYHYHPLALVVFGKQLLNSGRCFESEVKEIKQRNMNSKESKIFNDDNLFGVLRRGYDFLPEPFHKSLFMDVVLFNPLRDSTEYNRRPLSFWRDSKEHNRSGARLYEWLMIVHNKQSPAPIIKGVRVGSFVRVALVLHYYRMSVDSNYLVCFVIKTVLIFYFNGGLV